MFKLLKQKTIGLLRWSEQYTKIDMVYLASGNFWLMMSRVIGVGSGILLTLAFANLIPPETFGTYKYILSIAGIVGAFSLNGLNPAVMRTVAKGNPEVIRPIFWISLKWSLPASIIAVLGGLYYLFQGNITLAVGLALIAIVNPFFNSFIFTKSLLLGLKEFKQHALYNIPRTVIPVAALIATLFLTDNILIILSVYFISNFISGYFVYTLVMRDNLPKKRENSGGKEERVRETVSYGKHLSAVGILMQVVGYIDQFLLWHFVGPVQLAFYTFAYSPVRHIQSLGENIFPLVFPKFAVKKMRSVKEIMPMRIKQMFSFSALLALSYVIAAPFIFKIFFPQYIGSVFASQLLALVIVLQPKGLVDVLMTTHEKVKERYIFTISTSVVRLGLLAILIPIYGFMGAVWAIILSELASAVILLILYKKI